jgi:hypothetical protein
MRFLLVFLLVACAHAPTQINKPPAGYAYTDHFFAQPKSVVEKAGTELLRDLVNESKPRVPGEVKTGDSSAETGWVYAMEAGEEIRRRYGLNFVQDGSGTTVILSLDEERKPSGQWEPGVALDTAYQAFFTRLQNKLRKFR